MRKIKKINGYLVVKFNERELNKWADTGLGNFGVIDAELYTGCFEVDRSVMEYDSAETIEEAIEQARSLESEIDITETPASYTIIKETDDYEELVIADPVLMVNEWEEALAYQIGSDRYPEINPETARHELYGFMIALRELGIYDSDKCIVDPSHFEPMETFLTDSKPVSIKVLTDPEPISIKVGDTAVMVDYLKRQRDMATHSLFCYSANYAMTKPKEGYEEEWRKAGKDCELVEELIRIIDSDSKKGPPENQTALEEKLGKFGIPNKITADRGHSSGF